MMILVVATSWCVFCAVRVHAMGDGSGFVKKTAHENSSPRMMDAGLEEFCTTEKVCFQSKDDDAQKFFRTSQHSIPVAYGVDQTIGGEEWQGTLQMIHETNEYMKWVAADKGYAPCHIKHELCSFWAGMGKCSENPTFMSQDCAPSCKTCLPQASFIQSHQRGLILKSEGKLDEALVEFNYCLRYYQRENGSTSWQVAQTYSHLGIILLEKGEYAKAMEMYEKVLTLKEKSQHLLVAETYNNMGVVLLRQNKFGEARALLKRATTIFSRFAGEDVALARAQIEENIAEAQKAVEARWGAIVELVLELFLGLLGLGGYHRQYGDFLDSKLEFIIYLIFAGVFALVRCFWTRPFSAESIHHNAKATLEQGKLDKALKLLERAMCRARAQHGENHALVASIYNTMGIVFDEKGKLEEALAAFEQSVLILGKIQVDHDDEENAATMAPIFRNMARVLCKLEKHDDAVALFEEALAMFQKTAGSEDKEVATTQWDLGRLLYKLGKLDEAMAWYELSVPILRKRAETDNSDLGTMYMDMGNIRRKQDNLGESVALYQEALMIYQRALGDEHEFVALANSSINKVLEMQSERER